MRKALAAALLSLPALVPSLVPSLAQAQAYPAKPVKMIIPVQGGSSSNDILGRGLARGLGEALGQAVVVENQPGASGTIGSRAVARAAPDGYTILFAYTSAQTISPNVVPDLGYDTLRDLAPVTMFSVIPYLMVVHPSVPARTARELVAYAKANPDKLNMGSSGTGSSPHLAGVLFMQETGTKFVHVPYKAAAAAHTDLLAGNVQVYFAGITSLAPAVKAGKARGLMVVNTARSNALPEVPTSAEAGFPTVVASAWNGVMVPAKTPEAIVAKLHSEISRVTESPDMKTFLANQGAEPAIMTPAKFGEQIRSELAQWGKLIKEAGIKME